MPLAVGISRLVTDAAGGAGSPAATGATGWCLAGFLGCLLWVTGARADLALAAPYLPASYISIVIDDLGYRLRDGMRAVTLPGAVSYSFLPKTPFARRLAEYADARGRELILHVPMESDGGRPLGPGGLTHTMTRSELERSLSESLASIPNIRGVSNHMGSLLTRSDGPMHWVMETLSRHPSLYFIDSRTTPGSLAAKVAREVGVPTITRDVFLDHDPTRKRIRRQLERLVDMAQTHGTALGIGHPYPETLDVLEGELPRLKARGIHLVTVSRLMKIQRSTRQWQLSLSRSLKAAKNSKPSPSSTCCAEQESPL